MEFKLMKIKLYQIIILCNILLLSSCNKIIVKQETKSPLVEAKNTFKPPVGIVDSGKDWSFAIVITCITGSNQLMVIYIDERKYPKGTKEIIDTGRIYIDKEPDNINYLKDDKDVLTIIKFLKSWLRYNLKNFTEKSAYDYLAELEEKHKGKDFDKSQYWLILWNAMQVEDALELIGKKYPELYTLAP